MRTLLFLVSLAGFTLSGWAGDRPGYATPPVGSALRKQLMDTIRIPAEEHLGQSVIFKVTTLRVTDTWAFFLGTAIQPNGKPVDFRKSKAFREDPQGTKGELDAGMLYGGVDALLKREGNRWRIVAITYDASDVHWIDYDKRFGCPHNLIGDPVE